VRDGRERDAVGLEMLGYLCHHPTPSSRQGKPGMTRMRPGDPWQFPARRGRPAARMIAGSRPFPARASHHASAEGADKMVKAPPGRCRQDRSAGGRFPQRRLHVAAGQARQVRVAARGLRG